MLDFDGVPAQTNDDLAWSSRLGAHLEASRQHSGLRRVDLADRLGVSEETIRLWEKGSVQPSADRLARLIALLSLESSEWPAPARPSPDLAPLARRLRVERDGRAITQVVAAQILDVSQAAYAAWETGRSTPAVHFFPSLAAFLGITEADIATLCASPFVVDYAGWPPFGQFVGARRQELRLKREDLAGALGVSQGTVVAWELGYRTPGSKHLAVMAEALSVDTASLVAALPKRRATTGLGELILARQRELGLLSADVARLIPTTEATVSRWVNGRSKPARKNLKRLATVLDIPYREVAEAAGMAA